ncbi:iron-containing alcohol dehydrogenase [Oscillibacter sp. MSJ-2]|uniref:Iron-containing alcohol dehydrogenase n=1 Tax=Dysosmobacter acutus TaxID=2841504 RepID=A0ABS6F5C4_9FIRM|nr:iron-containing alcohol dehydrogenase [Dysosmobacter acutus]MBU5625487.1 iron-containing alcohol dehydrogenase [Dysosmobacter acutus]
MLNSFVYDIPTKVYFGKDQMNHLGPELRKFGTRVLLVYGGGSIKKTGLYDRVAEELRDAGLSCFELSGVDPNPRITSVAQGANLCREHGIDVLLAVGGGSVIDCAKVIAAAANYDGDPWDIVTQKVPCPSCLPVVTILTIAATGSEMDPGCVISKPDTMDKIGVYTQAPRVSFLDPTHTFSVGRRQTACGSADILSHVMEVYFSRDYSMDMIDGFMESMMRSVLKYAPVALAEPENYEARANLMWAASWAINGFIEYGKIQRWACHPMEHELSAVYDITHGLGLAILTPRWMEYALSEQTAPRYKQFAVNVLGMDAGLDDMEAGRSVIEALKLFFYDKLGLESTFTEIGIGDEHFAAMAEKACGGSVLNAFRPLARQDIENIFRMCL